MRRAIPHLYAMALFLAMVIRWTGLEKWAVFADEHYLGEALRPGSRTQHLDGWDKSGIGNEPAVQAPSPHLRQRGLPGWGTVMDV